MSRIRLKGYSTAERLAYTPADREVILDEDLNTLYRGDGVTLGGIPLSNNLFSLTSDKFLVEKFTDVNLEGNSEKTIAHTLNMFPQIYAYEESIEDSVTFSVENMIGSGDFDKSGTVSFTELTTNSNLNFDDLSSTANSSSGTQSIPFINNVALNKSLRRIDGNKNESILKSFGLTPLNYDSIYHNKNTGHILLGNISLHTIAPTSDYQYALNEYLKSGLNFIGFDEFSQQELFRISVDGMFGNPHATTLSNFCQSKVNNGTNCVYLMGDWDSETYKGFLGSDSADGTFLYEFDYKKNEIVNEINTSGLGRLNGVFINPNTNIFYVSFFENKTSKLFQINGNGLRELTSIKTRGTYTYNYQATLQFFTDNTMVYIFNDNATYLDIINDKSSGFSLSNLVVDQIYCELIEFENTKFVQIIGSDSDCNGQTFKFDGTIFVELTDSIFEIGTSDAEGNIIFYQHIDGSGNLLIDSFVFEAEAGTTNSTANRTTITSGTHDVSNSCSTSGGGKKFIWNDDVGDGMKISCGIILREYDKVYSSNMASFTKQNINASKWDEITNCGFAGSMPSGASMQIQFKKADGTTNLPSPYDSVFDLDSTLYDNIKGNDANGSYQIAGSGSDDWELAIGGKAIMVNTIAFDTDLETTALKIISEINQNSKNSTFGRQLYSSLSGSDTILIVLPYYDEVELVNGSPITNTGTATGGTSVDLANGKTSLMDIIKLETGSRFGFKINLLKGTSDYSPFFQSLKFYVSNASYRTKIKDSEIEISVNEEFVRVKNLTNKTKTIGFEVSGVIE